MNKLGPNLARLNADTLSMLLATDRISQLDNPTGRLEFRV